MKRKKCLTKRHNAVPINRRQEVHVPYFFHRRLLLGSLSKLFRSTGSQWDMRLETWDLRVSALCSYHVHFSAFVIIGLIKEGVWKSFYACSILISPEVLLSTCSHIENGLPSRAPNTRFLEFPSLQCSPPSPRDVFSAEFLEKMM